MEEPKIVKGQLSSKYIRKIKQKSSPDNIVARPVSSNSQPSIISRQQQKNEGKAVVVIRPSNFQLL